MLQWCLLDANIVRARQCDNSWPVLAILGPFNFNKCIKTEYDEGFLLQVLTEPEKLWLQGKVDLYS